MRVFVCAGFIDFIVDPCFQVMGDMLEAIVRPLQENKDEGNAAAAAAVNHLSRSSSLSSQSSARSTPSPMRARKRKIIVRLS